MNNERKLKIHTKHQTRTNGSTTIPVIKLEGKWLEKLGFSKEKMIIVQQNKNKLIITIDKN
ncbi:type I toxin-antitoxin system SymE family toxin [Flavobacterium sp. N2038]|uniref:type I toxin-antitoxin system SymE family toxin n=1 Tax=Flavobacterium sp. N2038 TaxID=2986829 RepID=UPI00222571C0|nr:type I toxin-antitoxin system SymE family toxin [Flavobacterium sp. N2038]